MTLRIAHINLAKGYRGGERQAELLIRALQDLGQEQVLIARPGRPLAERLGDAGIEIRGCNGLLSAFGAVDGVRVYGPTGNGLRVSTLVINIGALPADQVGEMLDADYHVCVRAGLHCAPLVHEDEHTVAQNGAVRISPGYFTDDEDIDQAIRAVTEIAEFATAA